MVSAAASWLADRGLDGAEDVVLVVEEERELRVGLAALAGELLLGLRTAPG